MKILVGGLLAIIVTNIVLVLTGHAALAVTIGTGGTGVFMLTVLLWIAGWDSRGRWPGLSFTQRLAKIMWFER
jgi:hypothetical protein